MMTPKQMQEIKAAFIMMASYYGRPPYTDAALKMLSGDLGDLDFNEVMTAIGKYKNDSRNRLPPLPAQLRDIVHPRTSEKDEARFLAGKIIGCIARYGYTWEIGYLAGGVISFSGGGKTWPNFHEALLAEVGEAGAYVIRLMGGWKTICERERDENTGVLQAQVRDLCESALVKAKNGTLEIPTSLNMKTLGPGHQSEVPEALRAIMPRKELE